LERGDCDSSWPEAAGVEFRRPSLDWHWNFWLVGVRAPPSSDCRNSNSCCQCFRVPPAQRRSKPLSVRSTLQKYMVIVYIKFYNICNLILTDLSHGG